uniref:Acylglycerol kinase, mitochondrial n=1 Tax=Aceria tosichella TaxID=561515 RepID=A0A6G1SJK7_9ACAR
MSLFKLMARNWKSSTLYLSVTCGGLAFYYDYTLTHDVMRNSCKKAAYYGEERLSDPNAPVRHITVILNPVANQRKSKKLYTKWVEPLFHLAGIKVSLVETERAGQEYNLMEIMSNCDGVAIVGGDGTIHEAINGLLSRPDYKKAAETIPIGLIPAGQNNSIARYVHQNHIYYRNQKEFLIQATMRLVDSCTQKFDVIKIEPLDSELKQQQKPIYALRDLRYGLYQNNFYKVSGYAFYQKYIKPLWLRIKPNGKPPKIEKIEYTDPASLKSITVGNVDGVTDFRACMMGHKKVRLSLGRNREYNPSDVTETKDVRLNLVAELDEKMKLSATEHDEGKEEEASKDNSKEKVDEDKFLIDGQPSQAHSVVISAIDNALTIFTGPHKIIIPKKAVDYRAR